MSEIKFACPHCQQHIACDGDYADLRIVCPSCGKPMVVPALSAIDPAHPPLRLVASIPAAHPRGATAPPPLDPWTREQWEQNASLKSASTPAWIISALLTFIVAAVLKALGLHAGWIILAVAIGCVISGILMAKQTAFLPGSSEYSDPEAILESVMSDLLRVAFWIIVLPVLGVGLLFVGCAVCN